MCDRDLPKYESYIQRLLLFSKASHLKIVYSNKLDCMGYYSPEKNLIALDSDLSEAEEVAVFLHELGHFVDDELKYDSKLYAKVNKAYSRYNTKKRLTKSQFRLIMNCERRAWKYGVFIAKKLKIPLGSWFFQVRKSCLRAY